MKITVISGWSIFYVVRVGLFNEGLFRKTYLCVCDWGSG